MIDDSKDYDSYESCECLDELWNFSIRSSYLLKWDRWWIEGYDIGVDVIEWEENE